MMDRLRIWVALLTTSIVTLTSLVSVVDDRNVGVDEDGNEINLDVGWTRPEKWALSVVSISIAFSFFGSLLSLHPSEKTRRLELYMIGLVLIFWVAGLPSILDPDNNLAVTATYAIANANLFFFSYASVICSIFLMGSWYKDSRGEEASPVFQQWLLLVVVSVAAMSASAAYYKTVDCKVVGKTQVCNRTRYSLYLNMVTVVVSVGCSAANRLAPIEFQSLVAFLLVICYGCAVAYVTFGSGPGTTLGTLYFATWLAFFLTINITVTGAKHYIEEKNVRITMGEQSSSAAAAATTTTAAGASPPTNAEDVPLGSPTEKVETTADD